MFGSILQQAITSLFLILTFKIQRVTGTQNDTILERISLSVSQEEENRISKEQFRKDRATLKARTDSLRNLRVTIAVMWFASLFSLVYSIGLFVFYDENCQPQLISDFLNSFFILLDRFSSYLLWQYPIIFLFWPTKRHQVQEKRIHKLTLSSSMSTRDSVSQPADSSSSDDDNEYDFAGMISSHRFEVKNNFNSIAESTRNSISFPAAMGGLTRYEPVRQSGQLSNSSLLQNEDDSY
jgi:hypothetical protein